MEVDLQKLGIDPRPYTCVAAGGLPVSYLVIGLTLASTTDRPLQHFMLSGNSWIPVREMHRGERKCEGHFG